MSNEWCSKLLLPPPEPLRHLWCSSAARYFPARVRDNGDSPSRRLLQENGGAGRRSRLKIQAGCRPARHTLPDPKDVDALWSANSAAGSAPATSAEPAISAFIGGNEPSCSAKSEEADLRTPDLDDVVL